MATELLVIRMSSEVSDLPERNEIRAKVVICNGKRKATAGLENPRRQYRELGKKRKGNVYGWNEN